MALSHSVGTVASGSTFNDVHGNQTNNTFITPSSTGKAQLWDTLPVYLMGINRKLLPLAAPPK
jgi:hypothetical protein